MAIGCYDYQPVVHRIKGAKPFGGKSSAYIHHNLIFRDTYIQRQSRRRSLFFGTLGSLHQYRSPNCLGQQGL